jgi:hypothetical protein
VLKQQLPEARIVGPVVYRSGVFGLVSSFRQENGDLTRQVIGLGRAPILDGQQAAVSLRLTDLGAQILWESFQLPTPDVSFTFEMEVAGYHSPVRGLITADFDRLYRMDEFGLGVTADYLGAEIEAGFDKAVEDGVITVEMVGSDTQVDRLIQVAYDKLSSMMFEKNETASPEKTISRLASSGKQTSLLEKAGVLLASSGADAATKNKAIRASNATAIEGNAKREDASQAEAQAAALTTEAAALKDSIAAWEGQLEAIQAQYDGKYDVRGDASRKVDRLTDEARFGRGRTRAGAGRVWCCGGR